MYIPAVVAVAEHFHKRQSLAMGICVCGTGVGTFLLAPAELYFLDRCRIFFWNTENMFSVSQIGLEVDIGGHVWAVCAVSGPRRCDESPAPAPSPEDGHQRPQ